MANHYVRSADGNNADDGSTWALAKATLAGAAAIDAAGDTIFVQDTHAETGAGTTQFIAGTAANPVRILSVSDTNEPATTLAAGASLTANATSGFLFAGSLYAFGLTVISSHGANGGHTFCSAAGSVQFWDTCTFRLTANDNRPRYAIGPTSGQPTRAIFKDCTFRFANASQAFAMNMANVDFIGGGIESGGTSPSTLFAFSQDRGSAGVVRLMGFDLSALSSSVVLTGMNSNSYVEFVNCKLPSSWSGTLAGTMVVGARVAMYNCDSGDTNYRLQIEDYAGVITQETTIVRTGGASDGTTPISWKLAGNANTNEYTNVLRTDWIAVWNETTGSALTATLETVTDNVTFTDAQAWIEVMYLGTSGFPQATLATDKRAGVLTSAANQASSSETWTTTALTTPVKQKLAASFTAEEKGVVYVRAALATNATVYVCPKVSIA